MKKLANTLSAILLSVLLAFCSGCTDKRDYGTEFNLETDCQYSYFNSVSTWKKVQTDGKGQYLYNNNYIYYYSDGDHKLIPLCNKPNCLHDMETDKKRQENCNAFVHRLDYDFIQYYEGYVYYYVNDAIDDLSCLYRVSTDGGRKDKIFTAENEDVGSWLIHRGVFYYAVQSSFTKQDNKNQIYTKFTLKSLDLSADMDEKKAKVIYETDEKYTALNLNPIKAFKNYLCYSATFTPREFKSRDQKEWLRTVHTPTFIYNIDTGENREIPIPEGNGSYTTIGEVTFLNDRLLVKLYNNLNDLDGTTGAGMRLVPIYSMNFDLTDVKLWHKGVEQGKLVQGCGDHVIISDAMLPVMSGIFAVVISNSDYSLEDMPTFEEMSLTKTDVEIYSADGTRVSWFVYPMNNKGNFNGFGPDGYNAEFKNNGDGSWSVFRLKLDDVLHCRGEKVELDCVSTRRYGALNRPED